MVFNTRTTRALMKRSWHSVTDDEKEVWRRKARMIIYPDSRSKYEFDYEMVESLATTLYECHVFSQQGGGKRPTGKNEIRAIFEENSPEDTDYTIRAVNNAYERKTAFKYGGGKAVREKNNPHPMGEPVSGKYFAFVEMTQRVTYHTHVVETEHGIGHAKVLAQDAYDRGDLRAKTISKQYVDINIKPMREKHVKNS